MHPPFFIRIFLVVSTLVVTLGFGTAIFSEDTIRVSLPGRRVKVATVAIGRTGNRDKSQHDKQLRLALDHLETAGQQAVDIVCLPEEFAGTTPETIPGPTTTAVAELAKKYRMYVVCPMCEQSDDGRQYNTAVLLGRDGEVQGRYREVFIWWGEGLNPSKEGVPVFDTDSAESRLPIASIPTSTRCGRRPNARGPSWSYGRVATAGGCR